MKHLNACLRYKCAWGAVEVTISQTWQLCECEHITQLWHVWTASVSLLLLVAVDRRFFFCGALDCSACLETQFTVVEAQLYVTRHNRLRSLATNKVNGLLGFPLSLFVFTAYRWMWSCGGHVALCVLKRALLVDIWILCKQWLNSGPVCVLLCPCTGHTRLWCLSKTPLLLKWRQRCRNGPYCGSSSMW